VHPAEVIKRALTQQPPYRQRDNLNKALISYLGTNSSLVYENDEDSLEDYNRDLVTQFLRLCSSQTKLSKLTGISERTISKLEYPETYGERERSAQRLWRELQSIGVDELIKQGLIPDCQ